MNGLAIRSYQRNRHRSATKHPLRLPGFPTPPRRRDRTLAPTTKGALPAMRSTVRLFAIAVIFAATSIAWVVLGGVMSSRSGTQSYDLRSRVAELWGQPQVQSGPSLAF